MFIAKTKSQNKMENSLIYALEELDQTHERHPAESWNLTVNSTDSEASVAPKVRQANLRVPRLALPRPWKKLA